MESFNAEGLGGQREREFSDASELNTLQLLAAVARTIWHLHISSNPINTAL